MSEVPITIDEIEQLRRDWVEMQLAVVKAKDDRARFADIVQLGSPADGGAESWRAGVEAVEAEERMKWLGYQDALARWQMQEADKQIAASTSLGETNTRIAQTQKWTAIAVAAFTLLQLALALAQAFHWIKP